MPELPEIYCLALQMSKELEGKIIRDVEVRQEKCLNMAADEFTNLVTDKEIEAYASRGKWIFIKLEPEAYFMLSLGMGGNVLYHKAGASLPEKYQLAFTFDDGSRLSIGFWWFGYAHAAMEDRLGEHKMTAKLGISPLDDSFTYERLNGHSEGKKRQRQIRAHGPGLHCRDRERIHPGYPLQGQAASGQESTDPLRIARKKRCMRR